MKSLIVPIAFIICLIALFVLIDRNEFNRYDNRRSIQNESSEVDGRLDLVSSPGTDPVVIKENEPSFVKNGAEGNSQLIQNQLYIKANGGVKTEMESLRK